MTSLATLPARQRQGTPRCSGQTGWRFDEAQGFVPTRCHQWKGLRRVGDLWACWRHAEQVAARAKRNGGAT